MKRILSALLFLACSAANAQFVTGQILTAAQLNAAFANVLATSGGTLTGPLTVQGNTTVANLTVTGTFTFPGGLSPSSLAVQIPNSLIGNVSNSTQSPGVVGLPSCASNTNALIYTNGAGFTCNTNINASTLGGQIFAAPGPIGSSVASTGSFTTLAASTPIAITSGGTGAATASAARTNLSAAASGVNTDITSLASPALGAATANNAPAGTNTTQVATTAFLMGTLGAPPAIGGVTQNTGAFTTLSASTGLLGHTAAIAAGYSGEFLQSGPTASGNLTSSSSTSLTSLNLTPGIWDIQGEIQFTPASGTTPTVLIASISPTTNTVGPMNGLTQLATSFTVGSISQYFSTPTYRVVVTSTTTYFLVGYATFSGGTLSTTYYMRATRI